MCGNLHSYICVGVVILDTYIGSSGNVAIVGVVIMLVDVAVLFSHRVCQWISVESVTMTTGRRLLTCVYPG